MRRKLITVDGNEAAASVAYKCNESIAIYPITPASAMGEQCDLWASQGQTNLWGTIPQIAEMQSEAGAAGAVHGALQAGALTTTFTASQGLLLKIPNMYKIAGELTPMCMHVAARTLATHALSIFGDHSDVMAVRQTGFALLCASSVQMAHDFAFIGQASSLQSRIPFLHFFDGFRTSHELNQIVPLEDEDLRALLDEELVNAHRQRALTPDKPVIRGTAQNPDVFFQAREACNRFYEACPEIVSDVMRRFAARTGRRYQPFDYEGHPEPDRVIVLMGSASETVGETLDHLLSSGDKVGMVRVNLYRPFSVAHFIEMLPASVRRIAVLDRTKEPGGVGEPLYLDVSAALLEAERRGIAAWSNRPQVFGGRYGLSSKEFDPTCVKAVFDALSQATPPQGFTVGIVDDVTELSLPRGNTLTTEPANRHRALFFGLGADGTVSANKNTIKIVGGTTDWYAQGYFVYDSKKSGAVTVSHLRFDKTPIRSTYLVQQANFIACHQFEHMEKYDVLERAATGATFLLNSPHPAETVWDHLSTDVQRIIIDRELQVHVIDAAAVAKECGLGGRINTVMQTCFFALTDLMPLDQAIDNLKVAIDASYGRRGPVLVKRNHRAVDLACERLAQVTIPTRVSSGFSRSPIVSDSAPEFVKRVSALMLAGRGDDLPVSAFPVDGTWPTGTAQWEKRNIASEIPQWEPGICIQCNQCAIACPHAAIRVKVYDGADLSQAPESFLSVDYRAREFDDKKYTVQVAPEDCTGCHLCVEVCPAKDRTNPRCKAINMTPQMPIRERETVNYEFFLSLPEVDREAFERVDARTSQYLQPLFEYSGACSGCGETPYVKLLTQLFGDRLLIANATGCSSIYGGNLPTTPYTVNTEGRGPAWSNSLFEDNAEFGFGMRMALDNHRARAHHLLDELAQRLDAGLVNALKAPLESNEEAIGERRQQVAALKQRLTEMDTRCARELEQIADYLVDKSVWMLGGDGWAYDIGFGGLDQVLAMDRNVNVLVMDTQCYSNTGGQQSKATPLGASAKFSVGGKRIARKDLGLEVIMLGHVYVAQVALGAHLNRTVKAFLEAEAYPGPSIIIAYSPCIAHGYDLAQSHDQQKRLVDSGMWLLYRFDPRRIASGEEPLQMDSRRLKGTVADFMNREARFKIIEKRDPQGYRDILKQAQTDAERQVSLYQQLSSVSLPADKQDEERSA